MTEGGQGAVGPLPPYSEEAERSVIGAVIFDPSSVDLAVEALTPDDFYRLPYRKVFSAVTKLAAASKEADLVSICEVLKQSGDLKGIGGPGELARIASDTGTSAHIRSHIGIMKEKAQLRRLQEVAVRIAQEISSGSRSPKEIMESAEASIFEAASKRGARGPVPISKLLKSAFRKIDELVEKGRDVTGIPSGYPDLDRVTSGFQNSDLIIIAGRPSMGKTSLALNIIENIATNEKIPVALFSLEMSIEAVVMRLLSSSARVSFKRIRSGQLTADDWPKLAMAAERLGKSPIWIDDTPGISPMEMRSKCRRLMSEARISLVAVDYLQLMTTTERHDSRVQEVSAISRSLKGIARELDLPLIALSQLSRASEKRGDRRPVLADLRDSGAIEQDADLVAFCHREDPAGETDDGIAELLVRKHRNGELGNIPFAFLKEIMRFESLSRVDEPSPDEMEPAG